MLKIYTAAPTTTVDGWDDDYLLAQEIGYLDADNASTESANEITLKTGFSLTDEDSIVVRYYDDTENAGGDEHGIQYGLALESTMYSLDTDSGTNPVVTITDSGYVTKYGEIAAGDGLQRFVVFTTGKLLFEDSTFKISGEGATNYDWTTLYLRPDGNTYTDVYISGGIYYSDSGPHPYADNAGSDAWLQFSVANAPTGGDITGLTYYDSLPDGTDDPYTIAPATTLDDFDIESGNSLPNIYYVHVQGYVPRGEGVPVENFRNMYININSIERSDH